MAKKNIISTAQQEQYVLISGQLESINHKLGKLITEFGNFIELNASIPREIPGVEIKNTSKEKHLVRMEYKKILLTIVITIAFNIICLTMFQYSSSTIWANRAYNAACKLDNEYPGDAYHYIKCLWQEGKHRKVKSLVKDLEKKCE